MPRKIKPTTVTEEVINKDNNDEMIPEMNMEEMTPSQYFSFIKENVYQLESDNVRKSIDVAEKLYKKYELMGQKAAAQKCMYRTELIRKEMKLLDKGFDTYVLLDDVNYYIKKVKSGNVYIIDLENFPREIPDDVVDKWMMVKDIVDKGYVVFTDYTDETPKEAKREQERVKKEKDPILFGALKVNPNGGSDANIYERLFVIGDWIDKYCDLTLNKMIDEMVKETNIDPSHKVFVPGDTTDFVDETNKPDSVESQLKD